MTPSVPKAPVISFGKSYPATFFTTRPPLLATVPCALRPRYNVQPPRSQTLHHVRHLLPVPCSHRRSGLTPGHGFIRRAGSNILRRHNRANIILKFFATRLARKAGLLGDPPRNSR